MHPKYSYRRLEPEELFFRWVLRLTSLLYLLAAVAYVVAGVQDDLLRLPNPPMLPMLTAALATKVALLSLLASTAAGNIRRARTTVYQLIFANLATTAIFGVLLLCGALDPRDQIISLPKFDPAITWLPSGWPQFQILNYKPELLTPTPTRNLLGTSVAVDVVVCLAAFWLQRRVERVQYRFLFLLSPVEYDVIYALAEVLIYDGAMNRKGAISAADVANNVDRDLYNFPGQRTQSLRIAMRLMEYLPLRYNLTTFSYMNPADRRATLEHYFVKPVPSQWLHWLSPFRFIKRVLHWGFDVMAAVLEPIKPLLAQRKKMGRKAYKTLLGVVNTGQALVQQGLVLLKMLLGVVRGIGRWVYSVVETLLRPVPPLQHIWQLFGRLMIWTVGIGPNLQDLWLRLGRGLILSVKQLVYMGYYGDPATHKAIGYVQFPERLAPHQQLSKKDKKGHTVNLKVIKPVNLPYGDLEGDVIIVGTGAAASIIAHHLIERGLDVVMIERGPFIQPSTLTGNEVEDSSRLYSDGLLQTSKNLELQIAQGRCVGGTTVVNNGICIDPPKDVLTQWQTLLGGKLDIKLIENAVLAVKTLLKVDIQRYGVPLNPSGAQFVAGLKDPQVLGAYAQVPVIDANIVRCLGCGYCNLGCRYGRKQDMLTQVLPQAQAMRRSNSPKEDKTKGILRIVEQCEATHIRTSNASGRPSVTEIECVFDNVGHIRVRGRAYVISAGAIASSILLHRSEIGGPAVGRGLSFNVAGVMTGEFDRPIKAYAGLQMSHYYRHPANPYAKPKFMLETWYNPPATQAMRMPGWFEDHFHNMQKYDHMMSIGVLVGTQPNNQVTYLPARDSLRRILRWIRRGQGTFMDFALTLMTESNVAFKPLECDVAKVTEGMLLAGKAMLAAGAKAVMPSTFPYLRFTSLADLQQGLGTSNIKPADMMLGSGHPQGGNALSETVETGVVDHTFRVHGINNLFVCDASVFPTSVGVNPQMTVMALARYAAEHHIARIVRTL